MNKLTIFVVICLMMISFVVESVTAVESAEVLRARLNVRKNTLKAENKVDAKANVGVDAGVGNGVNSATKVAVSGGLESQTKLISKNLRRNPVPQTTQKHVPQTTEKQEHVKKITTTTSVPEKQDAVKTTTTTDEKVSYVASTGDYNYPTETSTGSNDGVIVTDSANEPVKTQTNTQTTATTTQDASKQNNDAVKTQTTTTQTTTTQSAPSTEVSLNVTAIIENYINECEEKMKNTMSNIENAYNEFKKNEKEKLITRTAKVMNYMDNVDKYIQKLVKAQEEYDNKQKERTEKHKMVVKHYFEEYKKQKEEEKQKTKIEVENIIEKLRPELEEAERLYKEKKENATKLVIKAIAAIQRAIQACDEFQFFKLKNQLLIRYPLTAASLNFYFEKLEKKFERVVNNSIDYINAYAATQPSSQTTTDTKTTITVTSLLQQRSDVSVGKVAVEKGSLKSEKLAATVENEKKSPQQAILVQMNTNQLKKKLSQLH